jgi:hypothetical protein
VRAQIPEDLHFVLRMRHMFESLGYQSGFFLSQLFSSSRGTTPAPSSFPLKQPPLPAARPPPQLFNWPGQPHLLPPTAASPLFPPAPFHPSSGRPMPTFPGKDEAHMFHLPPAHHANKPPPQHMDDHHHHQQMGPGGEGAPDGDLKWPNGLSFFTALTGRADDAKLLFGGNGAGGGGADHDRKTAASPDAQATAEHGGADNVEEYLSLESHSNKARRVENAAQSSKFKRSFTLPARMSSSSVSASTAPAPPPQQQGMEYERGPHEGGVYSDLMETFLE